MLRRLFVVLSIVLISAAAVPVATSLESSQVGTQAWTTYANLSETKAFSYYPSIAVSGQDVHVVWDDNVGGNHEIWYRRSTDGGATWIGSEKLTDASGYSGAPTVAAEGDNVHLVWEDDGYGNYEVVHKRSTDGGVTWSPATRLSNNTGDSEEPSVAVSGDVIHVVWEDNSFGNFEIGYKRSTDGGITWSTFQRLTDNAGPSRNPSVAVNGDVVHVVWEDHSFGNYEVVHKRSTDGGVTWSPDKRISYSPGDSREVGDTQGPSVAVEGDVVHIVWEDDSFSNVEIVYKRSTDGGLTWSPYHRLSYSPGDSHDGPIVAVSGDTVHVVWDDASFPNDNRQIVYKRSTDGGVSWSPYQRLTWNDNFAAIRPTVAVGTTDVHVTWDTPGGPWIWEILYKRTVP